MRTIETFCFFIAVLVALTGAASLAGALEINLDLSAIPGTYTLLTSSAITGTFDSICEA